MGRERSRGPGCEEAAKQWESFIDAFVDFAVGGHVLPESSRSQDLSSQSLRATSQDAAAAKGPPTSGPNSGKSNSHFQGRAPARLVALGDVHGDIEKTRESLRIAGVIDERDRWVGGATTLVQVGDVLDRGGGELEIFYLLEKLKHEAKQAGGMVHTLLGNHETGNVEGWLRYASNEGFRDFRRWAAWQRWANSMVASCQSTSPARVDAATNGITSQGSYRPDPLDNVPSSIKPEQQARFAALRPSGPITRRFLVGNPVSLRLGDTLFVHGGVLPEHVEYGLGRINKEATEWLLSPPTPDGAPQRAPFFFHTAKAIVWVRDYSHNDPEECLCEQLDHVLAMLPGVKRMVMGHTIQYGTGVNAACAGKAVRVDVGMSAGCGASPPEVLEILNGKELRVLTRHAPPRPIPVHQKEAPAQEPQGLAVLVRAFGEHGRGG